MAWNFFQQTFECHLKSSFSIKFQSAGVTSGALDRNGWARATASQDDRVAFIMRRGKKAMAQLHRRGGRLIATVSPTRPGSILQMVNSLKQQLARPDLIYCCISPEQTLRPDEKEFLLNDLDVQILHLHKDFGPAGKLIAALNMSTSKEDIIVTFDDDAIYGPGVTVNLLINHCEHPEAIIAQAGSTHLGPPFRHPHFQYLTPTSTLSAAQPVDFIDGFGGVLYKVDGLSVARLVDGITELEQNTPPAVRDDDYISAILSSTSRLVVPSIPESLCRRRPGRQSSPRQEWKIAHYVKMGHFASRSASTTSDDVQHVAEPEDRGWFSRHLFLLVTVMLMVLLRVCRLRWSHWRHCFGFGPALRRPLGRSSIIK